MNSVSFYFIEIPIKIEITSSPRFHFDVHYSYLHLHYRKSYINSLVFECINFALEKQGKSLMIYLCSFPSYLSKENRTVFTKVLCMYSSP